MNLALIEDNNVTSSTMLILLAGIKMAATIGESMPCTANDKPAILYRIDKTKLAATILFPNFA
ncbi:MAG TPA: hypothetical protein VKT28_13855, partial [Puia sp.]|nr:hypothetical protein [Puia sp.]